MLVPNYINMGNSSRKALIHRTVRHDDGPNNHIMFHITVFDTQNDAIDAVIEHLIGRVDDCEGVDKTAKARSHLWWGGALRAWEWRRRGNQDYYKIIDLPDGATSLSFNMCDCAFDNAKWLDDL